MKKIIFFLSVWIISLKAYTQDTIYKNDGTEIKSIVTEITSETIKYKNFNQPDGPLRNLPITDVFMIIYKDGTREVFKRTTKEMNQQQSSQKSIGSDRNSGSKKQEQEINNSKIQKQNQKKAEEEKGGALFLKGGFWPIIGYAGAEYFINNVGLEAGWGQLTAPISQETHSTIGLGISLYMFKWYKSSPYVSIGYCADGAVYEKGMTIYDTPNNYWVNLYSAYAGYRVVIVRTIDLKIGTGYRWSEYTRGFSFEANIGLKLFSNKIRKKS